MFLKLWSLAGLVFVFDIVDKALYYFYIFCTLFAFVNELLKVVAHQVVS